MKKTVFYEYRHIGSSAKKVVYKFVTKSFKKTLIFFSQWCRIGTVNKFVIFFFGGTIS